ncbi:MAG: deoxyguanosinetriphosphate triphosphohydrolase, partial [Nitrospinota bacterium]
SELFTSAELKEVALWEENYRRLLSENPHSSPRLLQFQTIRHIINQQVEDVIEATSRKIGEREIGSIDEVRERGGGLVAFSPRMAERNQVLKEFLMQFMYKNYRVVRMEDKAKRIIRELFKAYVGRPEQLPPHVYARAREEGLERTVCDYIAGMTDRFAQDEYKKLFDPHERV